MSEAQKKAIFQFVKKAHDELKETVQQEDFADLLFEVYKSVKPNESVKARVMFIKNELKDEDNIEASDFISSNVDSYIEKLVKYIDHQTTSRVDRNRSRSRSRSRKSDKEDPLERNNLKVIRSDTSASSDDRNHRSSKRRPPLDIRGKRDDTRDHRHRDDTDRGRRGGQKNQKFNNNKRGLPQLNLPNMQNMNLLMMNMQNQLQSNPGLLPDFFNQIRPNQEFRNRKDTVFLVNLPREFRSLAEIGEIFKNKGLINTVNLAGRVPSVQFKKTQDAQNLINTDKFIVHKGIKVELSSTPRSNRERPQRRAQGQEIIEETKAEDKKEEVQAPVSVEVQESQDDITKKKDQIKLEREVSKQIEQMKQSINTVLAEKLRTLLFLSKRDYPTDIKTEVEDRKTQLKPMKEQIKNVENLEQLKQTYQGLLQMFDHSLVIKSIPQELFTQKTVMKVLSDHFAQFGTIDSLQLKLKEQTASIKYFNFESAEKMYHTQSQYAVEFANPSVLRYVKSVNKE